MVLSGTHRWLIVALAAFGLGVQFVTPCASAEDSPQVARKFVEEHEQSARRLLDKTGTAGPSEPARVKMRALLSEFLDYGAIARDSLADQWNQRSEAERKRFVKLLQALVEQNYERNLKSTKNYVIKYTGESTQDAAVIVHTQAKSRVQRRTPPVKIDYAVKRANSDLKVNDIITDGVSLVRNYRSQFKRIIQEHGWNGLMSRMEKRLAEGNG